MNIKSTLSGLILAISLAVSSTSFAEVCSWRLSHYSLDTIAATTTTGYNCFLNGGSTAISSKTVVVKAKGSPSCSISVSSNYSNTGSCTTPNVVKKVDVVRPAQCGRSAVSYCDESTGQSRARAEIQANQVCAPCGGWNTQSQGNQCYSLVCR